MAGRDIRFKVKLLDQSVQDLELDAATVCSDVKGVLEALTAIPASRQRLIYRGRVLRDDATLQELGIDDGHTIHLIERPDAAGASGAAPAGAASAGAGQQAPPDLNRLLQGVFSALGGLGQQPAAAGAAAAAAAPQQGRSAPTHLLQSIASFLQQLQSDAGAASSGSGAATAMPVTSLALGGTQGTQQLQNALTSALQHILSGQPLTAAQQAQLAAAASTGAATAAAAATAGGATGTYPHMQLVLAALGLLLTRTQGYLSGPLSARLAQAAQQLAAAAAQQPGVNVAEASQVLARVSGQLQSAAALLVELARAASASSVELSGSNPLLTANTASVLQQGAAGGPLVPAFPTLYPQLQPGASGDRAAAGGRPVSLALPDFSNPTDVLHFAGRLTNTLLTGIGTGIAGGPGSNTAAGGSAGVGGAAPPGAAAAAGPAAGPAAAGAAAPSSAQIAEMVAAALTSSLAPVIERVSADVSGALRSPRDAVSSGQFQSASTAAANVAAQTVSGTVGRVLTSVTDTLNRNLSGIEQRLQDIERDSGRQVNAIDIAAAVQHVLLPHMQPLGDVLGAAARAAASSAAAANAAAATAANAAQEAANAAAAAGQAAAASASAASAAAAPPAPTAPPAPFAEPAAAAGAEAGPSSGGAQPRGLGAGLRSGALPAKRKAQGTAGSSSDAADPAAAAAGAGAGGSAAAASSSGRAAAPAPGAAGRGAPPPDLGALMQMMMGGAGAAGAGAGASGAAGSRGQPGQGPSAAAAGGMGGAAGGGGAGDLSGLMQMMGGMLGGGGGGIGAGGAGGAGMGGMGGLLQMAGQIASDPNMQPLISGMANAVLGGGGGGAGGGAGLGGLLSGLLGAGGPGGMGGPGGSGARSATVVASMDDIEHELPADVAAQWRQVLEQDERAQASMAQGRGPLSEVYQAGAPTASSSGRRAGIIPGLPL